MTTDWQNRGGTVNAGMQLAPLDLNKEHEFELMNVEVKEGVTTKFGIKNRVQMVWKEAGKDKDYHRIWTNFNESYNEKASLVAFLTKVSPRPIIPGTPIRLGDYLIIGMHIKTMVQARIDKVTSLPSGYYDFMPASIKPANTSQSSFGTGSAISLVDALKLAQGAKNSGDAFAVMVGKVPNEVIQQFVAEDKAGRIKYPIT